MTIKMLRSDNLNMTKLINSESIDLVYEDYIFDNFDFTWMQHCYDLLSPNGSIFVHGDQRSITYAKLALDMFFGKSNFVNWIIWPYDWGGRSKRAFGRKHDDILWYAKGKDYKFYPERISIPKKTAATKFNKSGRMTKIPTDVWDDIGNFHTMDKERIKYRGQNIPWQKPERLLERIILATTDELDWVLDPFLGSGTTVMVCAKNNRNCIGFELRDEIFEIAQERYYFWLQDDKENI